MSSRRLDTSVIAGCHAEETRAAISDDRLSARAGAERELRRQIADRLKECFRVEVGVKIEFHDRRLQDQVVASFGAHCAPDLVRLSLSAFESRLLVQMSGRLQLGDRPQGDLLEAVFATEGERSVH